MSFSTFAVSLGLTLMLELPFVYLWGFRSRYNFALAILVNVLTNPAVVLLHSMGVPVLLLELAAIATEGFCYQKRGEGIRSPYLLALFANVFSYGVGLVLNAVL